MRQVGDKSTRFPKLPVWAICAVQHLLYCCCEMQKTQLTSDARRGSGPAAEAYLKAVGLRVRAERHKLSLSRRALAEASGVSERYLAELERGAGNASLLLLRQIAQALHVRVEDLASEPIVAETIHQTIAAE
jgi:DNA-binding XRE family transcriptional regulator